MEKIHEIMKGIGQAVEETLEEVIGHRMGMCILVFEFNAPGIFNYISNAQRPDMIKALRETADRLEANQDIPPITDFKIH